MRLKGTGIETILGPSVFRNVIHTYVHTYVMYIRMMMVTI